MRNESSWRACAAALAAACIAACVSDPPPRPGTNAPARRQPAVQAGDPWEAATRGQPAVVRSAPAEPRARTSGRAAGGGRQPFAREARGGEPTAPGEVVSVPGGPAFYDAPLEPPAGRVLHGMGQWPQGNAEYLAMLADPALMPASQLSYLPIGDWPRDWDGLFRRFAEAARAMAASGRVPSVDITLYGLDARTGEQVPVDVDVATGDRYDSRIVDVARALRDSGGPAYVRIGAEFSGSWNGYTPFAYPAAFRRVVEIFRREGATNVAFLWCYEPSAPADFAERDPERGWRWYPGDDVVDWFALDVFDIDEFSGALTRSGELTRAGRSEAFLRMAQDHGKPVILAEASPSFVHVTPSLEGGRRDWEAWYGPFFAFIAANPGIKGFHYVNVDWSTEGGTNFSERGWRDARINVNAEITRRWIEELRDPKYLHLPDVGLLAPAPGAAAAAAGTR